MGVIEHSNVIENAVPYGDFTPLVVHPWSGTTDIADETGSPRFIVGGAVGDTNLALATAVVGNDNPAYALAGLLAYSGSGDAVSAQSTSGNAFLAVALGAGAGGSFANYGSGPAVAAYGYLFIGNGSAPATPTDGGVLYVEGGALKYKGSGGTVTVLGPA